MDNLFEIFLRQWSLPAIQQAFYQLCINRGVDPTDYLNVYEKLKQADRYTNFKQKQLWDLLDKRRQQKIYENQSVCRGMNVLIIGAGPCGLRTAIELVMLGAHVVVVDSRDKFTRNNVLHLWKFVIEDLRNLGAKVLFPKFCTGSIEHISIRKLQFILLKVALVLGVQFYDKCEYHDLKEPQDGTGWRAIFEPADHILSDYEFDAIIGASGKYKCLPAFKHNPVRGKLAIGITANFLNHHTKEEDSVPEIQGVAYIYRQSYFDDLERKTKIALENIVYYKGDTHYFVMCGKKHNLINKGVLKHDCENVNKLLSKDNVDTEMLCKYVTQVVDYVTDGKLGQLEFALNARKKPDIAAFDFTTLESADHSTRFVKYMGHPLILTLVGDSVHEPFWPTGSGCARGFLSVMDTAWLLRNVGLGKEPMARLLAERESIYSMLSQTQPTNLSNSYHSYTIDPKTRYTRQFRPTFPNVEHLMGSDNDDEDLDKVVMEICRSNVMNPELVSLFRFCFMAALSKKIRISNFKRSSWADGCALAALISKYNPDFAPVDNLSNPSALCLEAFSYVDQQLGIPQPCKTHYEWATMRESNRIQYLQRLVEVLRSNPYYAKNCMSPTLLTNFNNDRALQCAIQARILRPRQLTQNNATIDPVFNFAVLNETNNVTVRPKRQKLETTLSLLDNTLALSNTRRSSIEPLNPELIYKIDKIASGSYTRNGQSMDQLRAAAKLIAKKEEANEIVVIAKQEEKKIEVHEKIESAFSFPARGSLAGVKTVSKFRKQFDPIKLDKTRQRTTSTASNSNSTTSSQASSLSPSDSSEEDQQHPADPMHIRHPIVASSLPESNGMSKGRAPAVQQIKPPTSVVYRSTTQHQFVSRRPISTPNMMNSPDLCKTFGYKKPETANAAQQQVYRTVSQRRMKSCALCNNEVYLAEQKIVDDRLCVHKQCFRCAFCNRILDIGKAHIDRSFVEKFGPRWYCTQHSNKSVDEKLQQLMKTVNKQKSTMAVAIVSPTKNAQKRSDPKKPSFVQRTYIPSSSTESSTNSLNEVGNAQESLPRRPPTPPNKKNGRLSSSKYRKRLSDLDSPNQLIEACKQRTNQRLESLGLKEVTIDENLELKTSTYPLVDNGNQWQKQTSTSDQENDRQSSESFEDQYYAETLADEEEEFLDAEEEFTDDDQQPLDSDDAWIELKSYLENNLSDSQLMIQFGDSTSVQAREIVEKFNKCSLLSHFSNLQTPPQQQKTSTLDPKPTPYFTPREGRSETVPDADTQDAFFTPRTTMKAPTLVRRSSTLDRKQQVPQEVDQLKKRIQQNAGQFTQQNVNVGIDQKTPQRANRQRFRRGPRRATVAVDLKRESLAPDDAVASTNLNEQQNGQTKIRRSPSIQQRRRAPHIRLTDENLERVLREIEVIRNRRNNEKKRQLQALQRRMDEIVERTKQVVSIGVYLEKSLRSNPRNKWELERWLDYAQQFAELENEKQQLELKVKICQLEEEYMLFKTKLHAKQDETLTNDNQIESEKAEKEIMKRLLNLLNEKDTNKSLLNDLESEQRPKTPPAELVKRAPSFTCYSAVFINDSSKSNV